MDFPSDNASQWEVDNPPDYAEHNNTQWEISNDASQELDYPANGDNDGANSQWEIAEDDANQELEFPSDDNTGAYDMQTQANSINGNDNNTQQDLEIPVDTTDTSVAVASPDPNTDDTTNTALITSEDTTTSSAVVDSEAFPDVNNKGANKPPQESTSAKGSDSPSSASKSRSKSKSKKRIERRKSLHKKPSRRKSLFESKGQPKEDILGNAQDKTITTKTDAANRPIWHAERVMEAYKKETLENVIVPLLESLYKTRPDDPERFIMRYFKLKQVDAAVTAEEDADAQRARARQVLGSGLSNDDITDTLVSKAQNSGAGRHHRHLHKKLAETYDAGQFHMSTELLKQVNPEALYTNVKISNIFNYTLDELFDEFKEPAVAG